MGYFSFFKMFREITNTHKIFLLILSNSVFTIRNGSGEYQSLEASPPSLPFFNPVDKAAHQLEDWAAQHPQSESGSIKDEQGCSFPSATASLAIGQHGQLLMQDVFLLNHLAAFSRDRIQERVLHANGHGAFGYFRVTHDISTLTKADLFNGIGKRTRVLVRFSVPISNHGSHDLQRGGRGFAIKFYTIDGNFDLLGNAFGVFPIREPSLFSSLVKSRGNNPVTGVPDFTARWDFDSLRPETILHTLKTYSDHGANSRVINGYGVHAFVLINKAGQTNFVKFHLISQQPFRWFNDTEIGLVSGRNPNYCTKDLFNAIGNRNYPKWTLKIQVMTPAQVLTYHGDPFDITQMWREEDFPLVPVGELILNENPTDFFTDIEEAAFGTRLLVPGIEPCPGDKMFQARMFTYPDSHSYRLGASFAHLGVNRPIVRVNNYNRNGPMRYRPNGAGGPSYFPNSFHGPTVNTTVPQTVFHIRGIVDRYEGNNVEHNFDHARLYLYKDLDAVRRTRVAQNLGASLAKAIKEIRDRALANLFYRISADFGDMVKVEMESNL